MDQTTVKLLRQAAEHIKEGKHKAARTILVELLRDNPEVDQAWYMLSFTVPVVERQIYALEQALKFNPNNDKALSRLLKLQGSEKQTIEEAFPKAVGADSKPEKRAKPASQTQDVQEDVSGDDLLSRRLLGEEKPEIPSSAEEPGGAEMPVEEISEAPEEIIEEVKPETETETKKEEKYTKKVFGVRRGIFLLVILIAIFISIGILGYSDQIKGFISGGDMGNQGGVAAGDGDEGVGGVDSTAEPTATAGVDLPPIWTPTPTSLVEPTRQPDETSPGLSSTLIDFDRLLVPDAPTIEEFDEIRAQLSAIMDDVELPSTDGYIVPEAEITNTLTEFARLGEYRDAANQAGIFFVGLGLSDSPEKSDSLMQNMWADPNGTLLFADTGTVLITDFDDSVYQKYSYAQSLVQSYRNNLTSFEDLGIYPMCSVLFQECEVAYALTKGEAVFFAEMWAEEYFGESAMEEFLEEPVDWFTIPSDGSPLPFVEASLSLPHGFGKDLIGEIYQLDRLDAVDDLYDDLPATTEQLMHLEKYLAHEEAIEVDYSDVAETLGVSWQNVYTGTLGEWKTYLLLGQGADPDAQLSEEQALTAAAGWGGDFGQVYYRLSTQDYVVVVEWAWDTPTDAVEFTNAFTSHLQNQSGANSLSIFGGTTCFDVDGRVDCIFSNGDNVVWVQAPDQSTITLILGEFGFGT